MSHRPFLWFHLSSLRPHRFLLLLVFAVLGILPGLATAAPSGNGLSIATAYQITSLADLEWMAITDNVTASTGKYYALMNDIDTTATASSGYNSGTGFTPIGNYTTYFRGTFLGNGHTISNLTIHRSGSDFIGLFGYMGSGSAVRNLIMKDVSMTGHDEVGGMVGYAYDADIANCLVSGTVAGNMYIGGVVAYVQNTAITQCFTSATVSGGTYVGGLCGRLHGNSTATECFVSGNVTGYSGFTGGIVGGITTQSSLTRSAASGSVSGSDWVGGMFGTSNTGISLTDCFAIGNVSATGSQAGGLGGSVTGGITITRCFASGATSAVSYPGGLFGYIDGSIAYTNCYWDTTVSGLSNAIGVSTSLILSGSATGEDTDAMQTEGTYTDWDFPLTWGIDSTKTINGGYPYLRALDVVIFSFLINNGATSTTNPTVTLSSVIGLNPTHYMASEDPTFTNSLLGDTTWQTYATTTTFVLPIANADNTIYFKVCNNYGTSDTSDDVESAVVSATITPVPRVTSFSINDNATTTTSRAVTIKNSATMTPTHYMVSEDSTFTDSSKGNTTWQTYAAEASRTLSLGGGTKTLYLKVSNGYMESSVVSASINTPAPATESGITVSGSASVQRTVTPDGGIILYIEPTGDDITFTPVLDANQTEYIISGNADFSGASWQTYTPGQTITLPASSGTGLKTFYFKTRNVFAVESNTVTLMIYIPSATVSAFTINGGDEVTYSRSVVLANTAGDNLTGYMVSEDETFTSASLGNIAWQTYTDETPFTLSPGNGDKRLYFKVCNDFEESSLTSATITLAAPTAAFVKNSVTAQSAHTETYNAKTKIVTSRDRYAFTASVQLPSSFNLAAINAATPINIQVGDITFSKTLGEATVKNLKAPAKGGSAVFKTLSGKTITQLVTVTWTAKKVLKVVVTGTPLTGTGNAVTTNILNALSTDDGTIAGTAPIAVGLGLDYARNTTGVVCTGTRTTKAVKNTAVSLNNWIMTGKK